MALFYLLAYNIFMYKQISSELNSLKNSKKAKDLMWFFKTEKGEYGAGDKFLGITVPAQKQVAKKYYQTANLADIKKLLLSPWHEYRLVGLLLLTYQYSVVNKIKQEKIYQFYLRNTKYINNWDLVDLSAYKIIGPWLFAKKDKNILYKLAKSKNIWERRIAVLTTFYFIKNNYFTDSLKLAKLLLTDTHDLIHKAVGWMLREIGKRDLRILIEFLDKYHKVMPRTMLRYAIERLSERQKNKYMKK